MSLKYYQKQADLHKLDHSEPTKLYADKFTSIHSNTSYEAQNIWLSVSNLMSAF